MALSAFVAVLLFVAISFQFGGTSILAFLFLGLGFGFFYIFLSFYHRLTLASVLLEISFGIIVFSAVFYIGKPNLLYYPLVGLLLSILSIFLHNQIEQFATSDDIDSIYIAIKSKVFQIGGIIGGSILLSGVYLLFLGIFPRVHTGVIDVLLALIAVSISLLILGWIMVRSVMLAEEIAK